MIVILIHESWSIKELLISVTILDWPVPLFSCLPLNLNILSITEISVLVVSNPVNAVQSLTTIPPPKTSLPRFTVPATSGT